jgi:cysteine-rich repeat protein
MRRHLRVSTPSNLHAGPRPSFATALLVAWVASLTLGLTATPAGAQANLSILSTPSSVAPGGRIGYSATVSNRGTGTKSFDLSVNYDANVEFRGASWDAESCPPCLVPGITCFPPFSGICTDEFVCNGSPCVVGNSAGTQFTLWKLEAGRSRALRLEVEVSATAPLTDPHTREPTLLTEVKSAEILSGGVHGTLLESAANTTVFSDAPKAPFIFSLSGTPRALKPGESISFRTLAINRGAFTRSIAIHVDIDPSVSITGFHSGNSAIPILFPTDFLFPGVEPGSAIEMRLSGTVDTDRIELLSSAVATDGLTLFTVADSETTEVLVCDEVVDGTPCDNGDVCGGDTCSGGKCVATACPEACIGAPDGSSCADANACTVEECIGGACVPKTSSGGDPVEIQCRACEICDPLLACVTTGMAGEPCRAAFSSCDVEEVCDGVDSMCPDDLFKPETTPCDDGNPGSIDDQCVSRAEGETPRCIGTPDPCGDFVLDPEEECDDGNNDAGDCCSPSCQFETTGSTCADDDVCNGGETCDGAGTCRPGTDLVCDAGTVCAMSDVCDPVEGCQFLPQPDPGCLTGFEAASLLINEVREGREQLKLKLKRGPALTRADFGDPTVDAGTAYTVCFYREDTGDFAGDLQIDRAGGSCGSRSCWKALPRDRGYQYRDREYSTDGVGTIKLTAGSAGRSQIQITGKNNARRGYVSLPAGKQPPDTGIAKGLAGSFGGARVQIRSSDGPECFEANLDDVKRSGPTYFKARN